MERNVDTLTFDALRSAVYHVARRQRFEALERWSQFTIVALGASAAVELSTTFIGIPNAGVLFGGLTAIVGAAQLAFDFSGRARKHEELQRKYFALLARVEEEKTPNEAFMARIEVAMAQIGAEEPPVDMYTSARAYNLAVNAKGYERGQMLRIPFWMHITHWLISVGSYRFLTIEEYEMSHTKSSTSK